MIFPRGTGSVTLAIVVMLDVSGDGTSDLCVRLIRLPVTQHGGDRQVGVIMKELLPPLGRRSLSPRHILCNGGLSDIDAELEKLAMSPWCAP
jgi:hypothetical protein